VVKSLTEARQGLLNQSLEAQFKHPLLLVVPLLHLAKLLTAALKLGEKALVLAQRLKLSAVLKQALPVLSRVAVAVRKVRRDQHIPGITDNMHTA